MSRSPPPGVSSPYGREANDRDGMNPALLGTSLAGDAASSRDSLSSPGARRNLQPSTLKLGYPPFSPDGGILSQVTFLGEGTPGMPDSVMSRPTAPLFRQT